jgi:hypothetical protein
MRRTLTQEQTDHISRCNTGNTHTLQTKAAISEKNSKSVRGVKMVKDGIQRKIDYDDILDHLDNGWFFKSNRVYMHNPEKTKHMHKLTSTVDKWLDLGWEFGTLSHLNQKTCFHCGDKYIGSCPKAKCNEN